MARADPHRGRFRAFLLTAFKGHLARERARRGAQKRGGGKSLLSIDTALGERLYRLGGTDSPSPEKAFDRRWALTVLERALTALAGEMEAQGRQALFQALRPALAGGEERPFREVAAGLGMSEGSVKVAAHRLRRRYREILRRQVAETLADPGDVDDEIRHLMAALEE